MSSRLDREREALAEVRQQLKSERALATYLEAAADVCRSDEGGSLERLAARRHARRLERDQVEPRHLDVVPPGAPLFASTGGVRGLLGIPGFAQLWQTRVPARALPSGLDAVLCSCGAGTALELGVTECSGGCSRWFLRLADAILVKRFEDDTDVAA